MHRTKFAAHSFRVCTHVCLLPLQGRTCRPDSLAVGAGSVLVCVGVCWCE